MRDTDNTAAELRGRADRDNPLHVLHLILDRIGDLERALEASSLPTMGTNWRPTIVMYRVWKALDESSVPLTAASLSRIVPCDRPRIVLEAIQRLIAEGYIAESVGRPRLLRAVTPFPGIDLRDRVTVLDHQVAQLQAVNVARRQADSR